MEWQIDLFVAILPLEDEESIEGAVLGTNLNRISNGLHFLVFKIQD